MTAQPSWVPDGIDTSKANPARVYDYWLGGSHNFRSDQDLARAIIAVEPNVRNVARANRAFLNRAVRFMSQGGVRQFIDLGSGIPTERNVHEVAQEAAAGTRVVYVDIDEVAVAHSRLLLEGNPDAAIVHADVRDPAKILGDPATQLLIDFDQPVGLLLASVLPFLSDGEDPWRVVAEFRDAMAAGGFVALSHGTQEAKPEVGQALEKVYNNRVAIQATFRPREEILRFFDGFSLVDPGLVYTPLWRPGPDDEVSGDPCDFWLLCGVGKKR